MGTAKLNSAGNVCFLPARSSVLTNRLPSDSGLPSSDRTFDGPGPVWVMAVLIGLQLLGENSSSETTLLAMSKSSSPRAKHFQLIHPNILFLMHY